MFCAKCGKQLPDGAKFCFGCGAAQENVEVKEIESSDISDDFSDDEEIKQTIAEFDQQYNNAILKKKKRKLGIAIAVICLVFLIIGGTAVFLIMNNHSGSGNGNNNQSTGTNQPADPSAKFVGTAKLDDIDFSIEAKSDNIYDGIELSFINGYETDVIVSNSWTSGSAVVILTDTEGKKYNSIIDWNNLFMKQQLNSSAPAQGQFSVGTNYTVKVTFDNLPSGTVADHITIENIMTLKTASNPKSVKIENTIPEVEQKRAEEESKKNIRKQSLAFSGTIESPQEDIVINVESEKIRDGVSINLKAGSKLIGAYIGSTSDKTLEVILKDIEGNEYNSEYSWKGINKALSDTEEFQGLLRKNSEYTITVKFDNIPENIIAESLTIKDIYTDTYYDVTIKNDNAPVSEKSSAELVESKEFQAEASQKTSEASKEETAESSAETAESKVSQAESSQSTSEPSKTESKTSSTEQPVKTSSGFKGSTRIEKYNFTIDANSDNIYDGIKLHFKNEGDDRVYVETKWMSYKIDAVLTDTNGKEYKESVSAYMLSLKFGDEQTINIQFENLPEGIITKTITLKYIGTMTDFSDSPYSPYLDKVSTAVIQNDA